MIGPIALALLAAAPQSGPGVEASCIVDQFTAAERAEVAALAQQNAEPPPALRSRLEAVGAGCAQSRGWTADNAGDIIGLALAVMIRDDAAPRLQQAGIAPASVDAWLARQDDQVRTSPEIGQSDAERLVFDLHAQGVPMPSLEANGQLLGAYVAALVIIERIERGLPLQ